MQWGLGLWFPCISDKTQLQEEDDGRDSPPSLGRASFLEPAIRPPEAHGAPGNLGTSLNKQRHLTLLSLSLLTCKTEVGGRNRGREPTSQFCRLNNIKIINYNITCHLAHCNCSINVRKKKQKFPQLGTLWVRTLGPGEAGAPPPPTPPGLSSPTAQF